MGCRVSPTDWSACIAMVLGLGKLVAVMCVLGFWQQMQLIVSIFIQEHILASQHILAVSMMLLAQTLGVVLLQDIITLLWTAKNNSVKKRTLEKLNFPMLTSTAVKLEAQSQPRNLIQRHCH